MATSSPPRPLLYKILFISLFIPHSRLFSQRPSPASLVKGREYGHCDGSQPRRTKTEQGLQLAIASPHLHLLFSRLCLSSAASDLLRCRCREDARGIMCFVSDGRITPTLWPPRQWHDISLVGREGSDKLDAAVGAEGERKHRRIKTHPPSFSRLNWPRAGGHEGPLWSAETS